MVTSEGFFSGSCTNFNSVYSPRTASDFSWKSARPCKLATLAQSFVTPGNGERLQSVSADSMLSVRTFVFFVECASRNSWARGWFGNCCSTKRPPNKSVCRNRCPVADSSPLQELRPFGWSLSRPIHSEPGNNKLSVLAQSIAHAASEFANIFSAQAALAVLANGGVATTSVLFVPFHDHKRGTRRPHHVPGRDKRWTRNGRARPAGAAIIGAAHEHGLV
mmetsp:Transcript_5996/g.12141  ORF Transcript_5996/g.12141 Transcript_5996/m.12141 type:complete len:220 (-) Transcript_5996:562-1221(-)